MSIGASRTVCWALCALLTGMASASSPSPGRAPNAVIKGRIIAVDSEEPISGVKVRIKGLGVARTNSAGRYKIRIAQEITGGWQVVISAPNHWRRKTWLVVSEPTRKVRADWNLLPKNSTGFDLKLFDSLTRFADRDVGTARWDQVPAIRLFANKLDCPDAPFTPDETCPEWIVGASPIASRTKEQLLAAIANVAALTGGIAPTVEIVDLPAGTSLSGDRVLVPGTLTLGQHAQNGSLSFPLHGNGEIIRSHVYLVSNLGAPDRGFVMLLVARGLGYLRTVAPEDLCAGLSARGLRTLFCRDQFLADPTDLDAAMGRALYSRPVGNRYPDIDPKAGR